MNLWHGNKILLLVLATLLPAYVFAASDFTTYRLTNLSQKYEPKGYYLIKDKTFGEHGCVSYDGKKQVNPGDSISFDFKNDCTWGGIKFKIFHAADNKPIGYLSQTIRDGLVSLEVAASCQGTRCNFFGVSPQI